MPKVTEQHREARRDQIIDAALACFATKGFHRTSMADIIAEAGLSAGAIYLQFESKQQIALGVAQRVLGRRIVEVDAMLRDGFAPPPPSVLLRTMMTRLTSEVRDTRMLVQLWGESITDDDVESMISPVFATVHATMAPLLSRWAIEAHGVAPAAAEAWANELVPVVFGLGQGYIVQSALVTGFDVDAYFGTISRVLDRAPQLA